MTRSLVILHRGFDIVGARRPRDVAKPGRSMSIAWDKGDMFHDLS